MKLFNLFKRNKKDLSESIYTTFEDIGYDNTTTSKQKGLNQLSRVEQLKLVFSLWLKNGFAKRLIQLPIDFIVGGTMFEPDFKSKDDSLSKKKIKACQDLIKDFNEDNKFITKFEKFATDLSLNGMLLCPVISNSNGDVTVGFIDPAKIDKVITNPYDITDVTEVKMKVDFSLKNKIFKIVRKLSAFDEGAAEDYDLLTGDAFFYAVNNVSNQPEGISDLLADIDMIQKLYELLINVVDSTRLANMFVMDVEIAGADAAKITQWKKDNPIPTRPTRLVHNEKVKQTVAGTGVRPFAAHEVVRVIKNFILGNSSYPPMWFADGQDANRAIAIEQGTPVYKKLFKRQEILINILKDIYTYVIHSAVKSKEGFIISKEDLTTLDISIQAPEIQIKNLGAITKSLNELTVSLGKAEQNKWLTVKTIRKSFISFINLLGFDIDVETEEAELQTQADLNPPPVTPGDPNNTNPNDPNNPNPPDPNANNNNPAVKTKMKIVKKAG